MRGVQCIPVYFSSKFANCEHFTIILLCLLPYMFMCINLFFFSEPIENQLVTSYYLAPVYISIAT